MHSKPVLGTRGSLHPSPSVGIDTQGAGNATGTEAEGPDQEQSHTRGQGQIESETTRQSKACTNPRKTQEAGASGTNREQQVTLPERDAYTSNRSSDQRLGFCQIVHEKSSWQDGFHWSGLEQKLFLCTPCGCRSHGLETRRVLGQLRRHQRRGTGEYCPCREPHCIHSERGIGVGLRDAAFDRKKISSTTSITITTIILSTPTNTTLNLTPTACALRTPTSNNTCPHSQWQPRGSLPLSVCEIPFS